MPMNAPEPWQEEIDTYMSVDSDHEENRVSHKSWSGFLVYVNTALVQLFSKKQSSVETSVFDAEFVNMKEVIDALRGLRHKLRMVGILISSLSYIYEVNMSAVHNTSRPESF